MRHYEHEMVNGQILLPDKRSAKATYGLNAKEYMDASDPDFLREGTSTIPPFETVFQLAKASSPITTDGNFAGHGGGWIIVEGIDASKQGYEHGMRQEKVIWKKS